MTIKINTAVVYIDVIVGLMIIAGYTIYRYLNVERKKLTEESYHNPARLTNTLTEERRTCKEILPQEQFPEPGFRMYTNLTNYVIIITIISVYWWLLWGDKTRAARKACRHE